MQEGFIMRTPRGREVTRKAYDHLGKTPPLQGGTGNLFSGLA
ncbi:MAG TPA: Holliday junction DNA helicase RuvB C-terminal domain-containing protein [Chitinophagaceae bacterium]|nr:Holliday junction DNA helicase RuvB C-terminal domain-containing protein [Chitinophagaceae bacterium]